MFSGMKYSLRYNPNKFGCQLLACFSTKITLKSNLTKTECTRGAHPHACGQPTSATHSHLIKRGEVLPGISLQELKRRRSKLVECVTLMANAKNVHRQQIVVIPASSKVYMSDKIPYVFRQNTDFLYFSGCQEPDSILVLTCRKDKSSYTLFMRARDEHSELWDGPRTGVEMATEMFGTDYSLPVTEFEQFLAALIQEDKGSIVWYDHADVVQPILHKKLCQLIKLTDNQIFASPKILFHQIRLIKSACEIDLMRESCRIASDAIVKTIQSSKPGMSEHQLFTTVDYECRMHGAEYLAYPPVVAAGRNANVIHYINNNQIIQSGNLVLMDAGCEYHGYSSDITRTWPISGKFTPEQKVLYEIVLDVQKNLIKSLKEMPSLDNAFRHMCFLLGERLQEINVIPKNIEESKLLAAAYAYCPHHVSHYLGMDVHDTGKISRSVKIQPGMIITMEPGVYINPKTPYAPSHFHGLGIRIEDDILVTENGPEILTKNCPKEVAEIEALAS
ncbi:putative Xaa-Pro aminopeptidase 3 [Trachymyrmex septentrionalis]|uniref:Putative Xaa-Pro aminopeptidase 3 n=1 Tax=Trachymyrmex septentrionalis TaxID=34720 RepID=A0A195F946_9HYME|nr:PREDICTED: probable Xaa-Pro aminopeptidase 3 [Trachymyrmex septentrionalis]XP_018345614.1 PREDICTED: probable Xaa-Pro aminopeptidase 3 [Trachymyrmex septentrionalis]KYN36963.1 putative Xaa-Pro aminopeptidase 3 [Trachymyrmex septentrionalis]